MEGQDGLPPSEAKVPSITVTQVQVEDEVEVPLDEVWEKSVLVGQWIDPGEAIQGNKEFLLPEIDGNTLGWDVLFEFTIRYRWPQKKYWAYTASTFVWVPESWRNTLKSRITGRFNDNDSHEGKDAGRPEEGTEDAF
jgi:hypothetical protein